MRNRNVEVEALARERYEAKHAKDGDRRVTIRFPAEMARAIDSCAEKQSISFSEVVKRLLEKNLMNISVDSADES